MLSPSFRYERALWQKGMRFVAGVDEVGCGAWAGPVHAAAVVLAPGKRLPLVRDSKTLSPLQRSRLVDVIKQTSLAWSVGTASVEEIAALNIRGASLLATRRALEQLCQIPEWILSDAFPVPGPTPCTPIVRGDSLSKTIAAASILAKVERDLFMQTLDEICPGYHFKQHKGYGTKLHQEALQSLGPSPIHRVTYEPIRLLLKTQDSRSRATQPLES